MNLHSDSYNTVFSGMGKLYHPGEESGDNDPPSWSEEYYEPSNTRLYNIKNSWKAIRPE